MTEPESTTEEPVANQAAIDAPAESASTEEEHPPAPEWRNWAYAGPERTYSNIPVTVKPGDVVTWPHPPATDGAWSLTDQPVNKRPDNWRDDPEPGFGFAAPLTVEENIEE